MEAREQHNVANAMLRVLEAIDYPLCFLVRRRRSFLPDTAATSALGFELRVQCSTTRRRSPALRALS